MSAKSKQISSNAFNSIFSGKLYKQTTNNRRKKIQFGRSTSIKINGGNLRNTFNRILYYQVAGSLKQKYCEL